MRRAVSRRKRTCYGEVVRIRIDASLIDPHSDKQRAAANFKGGDDFRPPRSGCGRRGRRRRNCPVAATRRWRARERFVAADAVVVELRADHPGFHPLVPKRPVGVLLAVAHGQFAPTPSATRAVTLRHVRLVRVRRISAGNRSRRHNSRSTTQYRNTKARKLQLHFDSIFRC